MFLFFDDPTCCRLTGLDTSAREISSEGFDDRPSLHTAGDRLYMKQTIRVFHMKVQTSTGCLND